MTALSELDRRIVAALQLGGRASWQRIGRLAGTTESTAIRHGTRLLEDGTVQVVGVADPLVCGLGQPVLVQLGCAPSALRQVLGALEARPDTRFLTLSTGRWDVITEIVVPSREMLVSALVDDLGSLPGVHASSSAPITRTYTMRHDWSRGVLGDAAPAAAPPSPVPPPPRVTLDETDRKLLAALAEDGRRSFRDLARHLTLGETGVRRRVERLLAARALLFSTLASPAALGFQVELLAWLSVDLGRIDEIAHQLGGRPEVRYVAAVAGTAQLVCEAILPDASDIHPFCTQALGALPGVRTVDIGLELENRKRAYRPFELGGTPS